MPRTKTAARRLPSYDEALDNLRTRAAIDAVAFAVLTGVAVSTVYAQIKRDEDRGTEDFPCRWFRIGQRVLIPSTEVVTLLGLDNAA